MATFCVAMNFRDLINLTSILVDDPTRSNFDGEAVMVVINEAYAEIANKIDELPTPWNIAYTDEISVTETVLDYAVSSDSVSIRRIEDVERRCNEGETPARYESIEWSTWPQRNEQRGVPYDEFSQTSRPYIYRTSAGVWTVGFNAPRTLTMRVLYVPQVANLVNGMEEPIQVPDQYRSVIAYRAALILKGPVENRENSELQAWYLDKLSDMMKGMSTSAMAGHSKSRKL